MREKIGQMGGRITSDSFPCNFCDKGASGGFHPTMGMQLCANRIYTRNQQEDTMAHGKSITPFTVPPRDPK